MAEYKDLQVADGANETRTDAVWWEGQPPDSVNNAGRSDEGMTARWYQDNNGSLTSTGSGGAYTVSVNSVFSALYDGLTLSFTANHAAPGAATLLLNAPAQLPAKPIVTNSGTPITAGQIPAAGVVNVVYKAVGDHFRVVSSSPVGAGTIGTNELADKSVTNPILADGLPSSLLTYDAGGRPKNIAGTNNQVAVVRDGEWVAENMPGDLVVTGEISPLTAGWTIVDLTSLGQNPDAINGKFVCLVNDLDYTAGETVDWSQQQAYMAGYAFNAPEGTLIASYQGGVQLTLGSSLDLIINVKNKVYLTSKGVNSDAQASGAQINSARWKFIYEARVYQSSLPSSDTGSSIADAYSNISDGVNSAPASGSSTILFKSTDGSITPTVDPIDRSVDLSATDAIGKAPSSASYITSVDETADLPNSLTFVATADPWLTSKTTDNLSPSATRLYVTPAQITQWNAAEPNLVDSVFGLTGDVKIGTLGLEASPPADGLIPLEKIDGTSWNIRVDALTGGAVTAAYANLAGDSGTAVAVGSDIIKIMGADNKVSVAVVNDDLTDGDAARISIVEANLNVGNMTGELTDVLHGSRGGAALHAEVTGVTAGFMPVALYNSVTAHIAATSNPHVVTKAQVGLGSTEDGAQINRDLASQAEAEAGTENTKGMTPLRTAQAIAVQGGGGSAPLPTGTGPMPTSIPAGQSVEVAVPITGVFSATHAIVFIHVPSPNTEISAYGVVTGTDTAIVVLTNQGTTTITGLSGNVTAKAESISEFGGVSGAAPMPSTISAGGSVEVAIPMIGVSPASHAITFIYIPSINTSLSRYGVITATDEGTVIITNESTSTISGLSGNITAKAESIS